MAPRLDLLRADPAPDRRRLERHGAPRARSSSSAGMVIMPLLAPADAAARPRRSSTRGGATHHEGVAHAQQHARRRMAEHAGHERTAHGDARSRQPVTPPSAAHGAAASQPASTRSTTADPRARSSPYLNPAFFYLRAVALPARLAAGSRDRLFRLLDGAGQDRRPAVDGQAAALRAAGHRSCSRSR